MENSIPFRVESVQDKLTLTLVGTITARYAVELHDELKKKLRTGMEIEVDSGGLEDADTCILQLLCALRKTALKFTITGQSKGLNAMLDRSGLRRELAGGLREAL